MTEATANAIYDILVADCDAREQNRAVFVHLCPASSTGQLPAEFRFGGSLGSGGKFYADDERWWVSCYPEDTTSERQERIKYVNTKLAALLKAQKKQPEHYFEIQDVQLSHVNGPDGQRKVDYWQRVDFLPRFPTRELALQRVASLRELAPRPFRVVEIWVTVLDGPEGT